MQSEKIITDAKIEVVETATVDVKSIVEKSKKAELREAVYEHGKETMKPGDKPDWFVIVCGLFALVCLGVSTVNVIKYGFDLLFGLMMAAYVLVAVFCLVRKLQYIVGKLFWKMGFNKRLKAIQAKDNELHFSDVSVSFTVKKKTIELKYEDVWDAYETENFYVIHYSDRCILPVAKKDVAIAEEEYDGEDLQAYFRGVCDKCNTVPEEKDETAE